MHNTTRECWIWKGADEAVLHCASFLYAASMVVSGGLPPQVNVFRNIAVSASLYCQFSCIAIKVGYRLVSATSIKRQPVSGISDYQWAFLGDEYLDAVEKMGVYSRDSCICYLTIWDC